MSSLLAEFQGDFIYLDTMLPYALLRGVSKAAEQFFARLEQQQVTAYTSVLTFDELERIPN